MTPADPRIATLSEQQRATLAAALQQRLDRQSEHPDLYDVVVVGGGAAGLTLALQIRRARPNARILVLERQAHPVAETTHKVGESTVEIAAYYLRDVLGLAEHLATRQIRKFGLRMFFSNGDNSDLAQRLEVGGSQFPPLHTYQLDRGRLENELATRCRDAGVEFESGCRVTEVELGSGGGIHRLVLTGGAGERTVSARWVVDASGRNKLLQRKLGLRKDVEHTANAAWFRIAHPIDINDWVGDDPAWRDRLTEGDRAVSTNHLMGNGYWVWLILLASGSISIGIVAEDSMHPMTEFNTFDKALAWLREHEPQCAAAVAAHQDEVKDFRLMKNYAYSAEQVFSGVDRWCATGESGIFLDPLYSPGLDLIAISNTLVTDIIVRSMDGEDVTGLAQIHDAMFRRLTEMWLAIYQNQYPVMGNAQVMTSKVIWDTAFYWGVFGLLFFQDKFRFIGSRPEIAAGLARLTDISNRMQAFFREWESIDESRLERGFVDLYAPLNFMVELHTGMADELGDAEFEERFAANIRRFEQLAGQLVSTVIAAHTGRYDRDDVITQIQRWQRDPLIAQMLATYHKQRITDPTSEGWMTLAASQDLAAERDAEANYV
ncbi:NAD(P)/FAD-dependent oxidoreductase [Nocardia rhizosphaerae]|uniref:NAD(P)/FAD-dependent oxidoreductase n=1 Tax=Nocardia rhizosphaerae TaxID=1691571 RepID=A0ABV8LCJ4_9NOCA